MTFFLFIYNFAGAHKIWTAGTTFFEMHSGLVHPFQSPTLSEYASHCAWNVLLVQPYLLSIRSCTCTSGAIVVHRYWFQSIHPISSTSPNQSSAEMTRGHVLCNAQNDLQIVKKTPGASRIDHVYSHRKLHEPDLHNLCPSRHMTGAEKEI